MTLYIRVCALYFECHVYTVTIVCLGVKAECTDEAAKSHKVHTHLKSFTACNSTRVFQEYIVHPAVFAMKLHLQVLCFVCA